LEENIMSDKTPVVSGTLFTLSTPSESLFEVRWKERVKVKDEDDVERNILALNSKFEYKLKNLRAKAYRILNEHSVKVGQSYIVPKAKLPLLVAQLEALREEYRALDDEVRRWAAGEGRERIEGIKQYIASKTGEENVDVYVKDTASRLAYSYVDFRLDDRFVSEFMQEIREQAEKEAQRLLDEAKKERSKVKEKLAEEYRRGMEALEAELREHREKTIAEIRQAVAEKVKEIMTEVAPKSPVDVRLARLKENVEALGIKCEVVDLAQATLKGDVEASRRLAQFYGITPTDDVKINISSLSAGKPKHPLLSIQA
jgi:hypothetical protein